MNYNNEWLIEKYQSGDLPKFLFFWGHQPSKDGSITSSCFSQWWISPFEVDGLLYATAEHWMMAEKARLFDDREVLALVLNAKSAAEAKKIGQLVKEFDAAVWDDRKFQIVASGNYYKFVQNKDIANFLIQTNDRILVEASPVDSIWGIGMAVDHQHINNPLLWRGENLLGYALMEVRDKLQSNGPRTN